MNINFNKIEDLYGEEIISQIKSQIDDVKRNINYLAVLGFTDIEDIFERYVFIFLNDYRTFRNKLDLLIKNLGIDYVKQIENDLSLLENLL